MKVTVTFDLDDEVVEAIASKHGEEASEQLCIEEITVIVENGIEHLMGDGDDGSIDHGDEW